MYCYSLDAVAYFEDSYFINFEKTWNGLAGRDLHENPLESDEPILKIMVTFNNGRWDTLKIGEDEMKKFHVIRSDPRFLEFMNPAVDKATGVEFLRKYLAIDKEDVYCFGDQGNDVGMSTTSSITWWPKPEKRAKAPRCISKENCRGKIKLSLA